MHATGKRYVNAERTLVRNCVDFARRERDLSDLSAVSYHEASVQEPLATYAQYRSALAGLG